MAGPWGNRRLICFRAFLLFFRTAPSRHLPAECRSQQRRAWGQVVRGLGTGRCWRQVTRRPRQLKADWNVRGRFPRSAWGSV